MQRLLAITTGAVYLISSAFPIRAAFITDTSSWPKWWGVLDVGLAFVLAIMAFLVQASARHRVNQQIKETSYRVYRILIHGLFAMLLLFFLAGDRIVWSQCLTGFAWRTWLLLYLLPWWIAALNTKADSQNSS